MSETACRFPTIAFIGFGEAAHALAANWTHDRGSPTLAYDKVLGSGRPEDLVRERSAQAGATLSTSPAEALVEAEFVFSLVTADQALEAAKDCAAALRTGSFWLDGNSCAPQTKREAAAVIEAAGGHYVDLAIMAPVYPDRHKVPVLLAGPQAATAAAILRQLGMRPQITGRQVGDASTIKMLRSVMIKGLEALTSECLLAARRAGVEDAVISSLQSSDPGMNWRERATYNLERMLVHGSRRAAEMEEVCKTLEGLGLPDWMSLATTMWQRRLSELQIEPGENSFTPRADKILCAL